ncbi:hypothetical protein MUCCIDRAFT_108558 [Mucor lusitanicus CBS 277.49]|uniref:Uncharacterized protein n=1 Tax=Mucor lusitanicus CBS 277.49 TaxID=747725 RepID=A0A168MCP8_MUCCL|nr:hypothetical protein MUCCIDRAFT_108558 [Mucor lusitanicus CBS 277.49]
MTSGLNDLVVPNKIFGWHVSYHSSHYERKSNPNKQRTLMAETAVLWFRAFGIMAGVSLECRFENHNEENKAILGKAKLSDGLGLLEDKKTAIFLESSG